MGMAGIEEVGFLALVEGSRWLVTHEDMMRLFCRMMELKGLRKMMARHVWATENNFLLLNLTHGNKGSANSGQQVASCD